MEVYNIRLQAEKELFSQQSQIFIKFTHKDGLVYKSEQACTFINKNIIQLQEVLKLPQIKQQFVDFFLFKQPNFFDFDQKPKVLFQGMVWLRQDRSFGKWDVFTSGNQEKDKVGQLSFNYDFIRLQNKQQDKQQENVQQEKKQEQPQKEEQQSPGPKTQVQIIVKNLARVPQKAYITLQNGKKSLVGPILKPLQEVKGQFSQNFLVKAKNNQVTIHFYDSGKNQYVGQAKIQLKSTKKILGAWILNQHSVRVGDAYLNLQPFKQKLIRPKFALELIDPKRKIINQYQQSKYQLKTFDILKQEQLLQIQNRKKRQRQQKQKKFKQQQLQKQRSLRQKERLQLKTSQPTQEKQSQNRYVYQESPRRRLKPHQILSASRKKHQIETSKSTILIAQRNYKKVYSLINNNTNVYPSSQKIRPKDMISANSILKQMKGSYRAHCVKCASLNKLEHYTHRKVDMSPGSNHKLPSLFDRY